MVYWVMIPYSFRKLAKCSRHLPDLLYLYTPSRSDLTTLFSILLIFNFSFIDFKPIEISHESNIGNHNESNRLKSDEVSVAISGSYREWATNVCIHQI